MTQPRGRRSRRLQRSSRRPIGASVSTVTWQVHGTHSLMGIMAHCAQWLLPVWARRPQLYNKIYIEVDIPELTRQEDEMFAQIYTGSKAQKDLSAKTVPQARLARKSFLLSSEGAQGNLKGESRLHTCAHAAQRVEANKNAPAVLIWEGQSSQRSHGARDFPEPENESQD